MERYMFNIEWGLKKFSDRSESNELEINENYQTNIINNVEKIAPLTWGEHCLECGAPECYGTCVKYDPRPDGKCKRFNNGIEKIDNVNGLYKYSVKISFREWAKLESVLTVSVRDKKEILETDKLFFILIKIAKMLPTYFPIKVIHHIRQKLSYYEDKSNIADILLLEITNVSSICNLIVETKTNDEIRSRKSLKLIHGFNRYILSVYELNYCEGKTNYISVYPENDEQAELYFHSLDLVTLIKPVTECINLPKIKCVVWDLDNTLWDGIISENDDVKLNKNALDAVKELDKRGILNSISSKNDYDIAFKKLQEFGISDYFLCPKINWNLKSANIAAIADILDIGIDTFAFVDDMEYEREEVRKNLPYVRTYDAKNISGLLQSEDVNVPVTKDSAKRRQSYYDIAKRRIDEMDFHGDLRSFVKSCNIKVTVSTPKKSDYNRCYELIQRTNQLNLSGKRISNDEIAEIFDSDSYMTHTIRVIDKYGDYGLVGVAVFSKQNEKYELQHFVMSCRAARKLIEQVYFEYIISYLENINIKFLVLKCAVTGKNDLLRKSIEDVFGSEKKFIDDNTYELIVNCKDFKYNFDNLISINSDN